MDKRIVKSIASMASVAVIGVGTSYALFTADPVTIQASSASTGTADLRICNGDGDDAWKTSVNPSLELDNLAPGQTDIELTTGAVGIFIGNDDGNLTDNVVGDNCNTYTGPSGNSTVALNVSPSISSFSCSEESNLANDLHLKFQLNDGTQTPYKSLTEWEENAVKEVLTPVLGVDESQEVKVFAQLSESAEEQNVNCDFDMQFDGEQPAAE